MCDTHILKKFAKRAIFAIPIRLNEFNFTIKKLFNIFLKRKKNGTYITFESHGKKPCIATINIQKRNIIFISWRRRYGRRTPNIDVN